MLPGSDIF
jgi:Ca2+-dependent lipid-binding protein